MAAIYRPAVRRKASTSASDPILLAAASTLPRRRPSTPRSWRIGTVRARWLAFRARRRGAAGTWSPTVRFMADPGPHADDHHGRERRPLGWTVVAVVRVDAGPRAREPRALGQFTGSCRSDTG